MSRLPPAVRLPWWRWLAGKLAAYYEDEAGGSPEWPRVYGAAFDSEGFKDFWRKCAGDVQDLGETIRESVERWARQRRQKGGTAESNEQKKDSK